MKQKQTALALPVDENGLNESEVKHAKTLQLQHPTLTETARECLHAAVAFSRSSVKLVAQLRESNLSHTEISLLLRSLGYTKQRITIHRRLVELEDKEFAALEEGKLTVNESIKIVRARKPGKGGAKRKKKPYGVTEAQCDALPAPAVDTAAMLASTMADSVHGTGAFRYLLKSKGKTVRIFVCIDN